MEEMRATEQRSASLEQDARQPRFAMEADVTADKTTCEGTEAAAAAVKAKHGESCSAKRVQGSPTSSISFGMKAESPALPRWDDVLVDIDAAAPKPSLSPVRMREQPPVTYFPPVKPLQRRASFITSRVLCSARLRRRILRGH